MSKKCYTEGALCAEPAKLYPSLREDALDIRLKKINSFNNSIQNIKDIQNFHIHEAKNYLKNLRHIKL